jgi:hypothetical protein
MFVLLARSGAHFGNKTAVLRWGRADGLAGGKEIGLHESSREPFEHVV